MNDLDKEKFVKAKEYAERFYQTIGDVHCPYFQEKISFNAKGMEHLKFKGRNRARSQLDQYMRLRLISLAPDILKKSHTLQGILESKSFEQERTHGQWQYALRDVVYFEFVAVVNRARVRIIVKQVEGGPKYFWSIIPFWRTSSAIGQRKLHNGNPEED